MVKEDQKAKEARQVPWENRVMMALMVCLVWMEMMVLMVDLVREVSRETKVPKESQAM
jgi:hypothetical protein